MKYYVINTSSQIGRIYKISEKEGSNFILEHAYFNVIKNMVSSIHAYFAEGIVYDTMADIELILKSNNMSMGLLPQILQLLERVYFLLVSFIVDNNFIHNEIKLEQLEQFNIVISVN